MNLCKDSSMTCAGEWERWLAATVADPPDDCWEWPFGRTKGYGMCWWQGKMRRATHVVLHLLRDINVPPGMVAAHTCDNPPCVNPDHLFVGTRADNNLDRDRKGRGRRLHGPPSPKRRGGRPRRLTDEQVRYIRRNPHIRLWTLVEEYGLTVSSLARIRRCETYADVM